MGGAHALACAIPISFVRRRDDGYRARRRALRPSYEAALENLEHRVDVGDVAAAGRRGAADEVEYLAVLHAVIGKTFHPAALVEIDCDHALVGDRLRHERNRALGALGNVVEGL